MKIDRRILSPPQIEVKEQKRLERRELKHTDKSKMGRRNKRSGKRAERDLESMLISWGYEAKRVPMSGALKGVYSHLAGDLNLTINDKVYLVEVKRRSNLNTMYNMVEQSAFTISNFCNVMKEVHFQQFLNGYEPDYEEVDDKRFKRIHDWFEQDNSDMVAMKSARKPWIFAVKLDKVREILGKG